MITGVVKFDLQGVTNYATGSTLDAACYIYNTGKLDLLPENYCIACFSLAVMGVINGSVHPSVILDDVKLVDLSGEQNI